MRAKIRAKARRNLAVWISLAAVLAAWSATAQTAPPAAPAGGAGAGSALDDLCAKIQRSFDSVSEAEVVQALRLGQESGRPFSVAIAIKNYMARQRSPSAELAKLAIDNAFAVGDLRTAVARSRAYLGDAEPSEESSDVAARMYAAQIDFLGTGDDAYRFMSEDGEKHRKSAAARKFDLWYLRQAETRKDYLGHARRLMLVMEDKLPLEQERLHYGSRIDWLMNEITRPTPDKLKAASHCRRVASLIRNDDRRMLRYALYAANLTCRAAATGKDEAQVAREYADVIAAAQAYVDKFPTAPTLKEIVELFCEGDPEQGYRFLPGPKREFFVKAFARLPAKDREVLMSWQTNRRMADYMATREQWMALGLASGPFFKTSPAAKFVPFVTRSENRDVYVQQSQFLEGVPSPDAAVINSLAAGAEIGDCGKRLMEKESWHLAGLGDAYALFSQQIWPAYARLSANKDRKFTDADFAKAMTAFGANYVAKTAMALDSEAAKAYVLAAWRFSGVKENDKSQVASHVDALAWVPYEERDQNRNRRAIFDPAYREFKGWADWVRREYDTAKRDLERLNKRLPAAGARNADQNREAEQATARVRDLEGMAAQISPLENSFRVALDPKAVAPDKAPNEMCKNLALAVLAAQSGNGAEFVRVGKLLYPIVKGYETTHVPLGRAVLRLLLSPGANVRCVDLQCEILGDALAAWKAGAPNEGAGEIADTIARSRNRWDWNRIPRQDMDDAKKLNAVIAAGLKNQMDKGEFSQTLFDWLRGTRRGDGWNETGLNQDLFLRMIKEKRLPTTTLMALVNSEFAVPPEYSPETYFDDMFAEEALAKKWLDIGYWGQRGQDRQKKVRNAAAKVLQGYEILPFGFGEGGVTYAQADYWRWQSYALDADPAARDAMLQAVESRYGTTRFDTMAMGREYFGYRANPKTPAGREEFFKNLAAYEGRLATTPERPLLPAMTRLADVGKPESLTDAELTTLARLFSISVVPWQWPRGYGFELLAAYLHKGMTARGRQRDIFPAIAYLWKIGLDADDASVLRPVVEISDQTMKDSNWELAVVYSSVGLQVCGPKMADAERNTLNVIQSRALGNFGGVIPVPVSDPRYPVYASQADFLAGNPDRAWDRYAAARKQVMDLLKELDPNYCVWLIDRNASSGNFTDASDIARVLLQLMDKNPDTYPPDVRARIMLAYADISRYQKEYPKAKALYTQIAAAKEFEGLRGQADAEMRIAQVDLNTGLAEEALTRLEKLSKKQDRYIQSEALYNIAVVKFEQQDFQTASENIEKVFSLSPTHAEARILEGKLNLAMKKLERATRVEKVSTVAEQNLIVPGKVLRITVEDKSLSVVGRTQDIRIRTWTDSGDDEEVLLRPFADMLTRFEGEIATQLAAPKKGDRTLQVVGGDKVHYDYTDAFKKAHNIRESVTHTLKVVSDSELFASSGEIQTKEQIEKAALEQMIKMKLQIQEQKQVEAVPLSEVRVGSLVKPGNKINVRVLDPDRCTTGGKDKIDIRVKCVSGDMITAFPIEETEPYSGVFEGQIPTAPAPAAAYATDSDEGSNPNFAISSGDYPAWVAKPDARKPKVFTADLNDSRLLGSLKVVASVPGRKIKDFTLQISPNGMDFQSVAGWPAQLDPWDGYPRVVIVKVPSLTGGRGGGRGGAADASDATIENSSTLQRKAVKLRTIGSEWAGDLFGQAGALGVGPADSYIARFSAAFYVPKRQIRTFRFQDKDAGPAVTYNFYLDGVSIGGSGTRRVAPGQTELPPIEVTGSLKKGVHRIDVYVTATGDAKPGFDVLCDTNQAPYMVSCPADMFDPALHPEILEGLGTKPAVVTASAAGDTFDIAFGENTRGRALRFVLHDFETDAPAISKIHLKLADGTEFLPTKADLLALRKNQILEIVPGDNITVSYEDPSGVQKNNVVHEVQLSSSYANGSVSAGLVVGYTEDADGVRVPKLATLYRYEPGDSIEVTIRDPDLDVSKEEDTVKFSVQTFAAKPTQLTAKETGPHTGVFAGRVFPVLHDPQRESEVKVAEGDDMVISYMDMENTAPGVPWVRSTVVERNWYQEPEFRVFHAVSQTLPELTGGVSVAKGPKGAVAKAGGGQGPQGGAAPEVENVEALFELILTRPAKPDEPSNTVEAVIGGPALSELYWPTIARSSISTADLFVQTSAGRAAAGAQISTNVPFDVNVPGTIKLTVGLGGAAPMPVPIGYRGCTIVNEGGAAAGPALGRGGAGGAAAGLLGGVVSAAATFTFGVPMAPGPLPKSTLIEMEGKDSEGNPLKLSIRGNDELYVGFRYKNDKGEEQWITRKVRLTSPGVLFDVMNKDYQEVVSAVHVGNSVYFRVINPSMDVSEERDKVAVGLTASSGATNDVELTETFAHSGVFKGMTKFTYAVPGLTNEAMVLPVTYGAKVTARYQPTNDLAALDRFVEVFKGADGDILPFSKRFRDPAIAVKTQLAIAEAYFELAKQHRRLNQKELSKNEISEGKRILEEAVSEYPDTETRAQADYLLANLSMEFAEDATEVAEKEKFYREAELRFRDIVTMHSDTTYAPKAQYKRALALEKLGEFDVACEEYVKLSYRWPDHELIAETIARLGQYFYRKGKEMTDQATPIQDAVEKEKVMMKARDFFRTSAEVFGRLAARFPTHKLADKTTVLSGQCYMRAEDYTKAVAAFKIVVDNPDADKEAKPEAMYWSGDSWTKLGAPEGGRGAGNPEALVEAYRMFKKLTWDFPASKWAKYARGRLAEPQFARIDTE